MKSMRIEKDTLGEVEVPVEAYYGAQTQRAIENFQVTGLKPDPVYVRATVLTKSCAARVNHSLGLLDESTSKAIIQACQEILDGKFADQFVVDPIQAGAGTSHHMNVNEVIANRATELMGGKKGQYLVHPNDHVNMAQSTNDVIPTAIRLACLLFLPDLDKSVKELILAFEIKAKEFADLHKPGRTHLQDAAEVTLGAEINAYGHALQSDLARIHSAAAELRNLGIGGTAVGSGLNAHPDYARLMVEDLSNQTGLELSLHADLYEAMQSMSAFAGFSAAMRVLAGTLNRIANDLRLLSSGPMSGLNEITLPAVQPGSSIMPGKVNPVLAEMLNMASYQVMGLDSSVQLACQAGQLELNVMMPLIAHDLFQMMRILTNSINVFTERCVKGIKANEKSLAFWQNRNPMIITALNPLIGYEAGARILKTAQERSITIRDAIKLEMNQGMLLNNLTGKLISWPEIEERLNESTKA